MYSANNNEKGLSQPVSPPLSGQTSICQIGVKSNS